MQNVWNLTFAEYKAARIDESGVGAEVFCEAYPDSALESHWLAEIADPPRDADLDLRVYDTLSPGMQGRWRKFNFTLDRKLEARTEAERVARAAPYVETEDYLNRAIADLEETRRGYGRGSMSSKENYRLQRLISLRLALQAPFATPAEKNAVVTKVKRFRRPA